MIRFKNIVKQSGIISWRDRSEEQSRIVWKKDYSVIDPRMINRFRVANLSAEQRELYGVMIELMRDYHLDAVMASWLDWESNPSLKLIQSTSWDSTSLFTLQQRNQISREMNSLRKRLSEEWNMAAADETMHLELTCIEHENGSTTLRLWVNGEVVL